MSQVLTNIKELKEERKQLHEAQSELLAKAQKEGRDFSPEEEAKYQEMEKRFDELDTKLNKAEETRKRQEQLAERADRLKDDGHQLDDRGRPIERGNRQPKGENSESVTQEHRALAMQAWCRAQEGMELTPEHEEACERVGINPSCRQYPIILPKRAARSRKEIEQRAAGVATDAAGNYTVAEDFIRELEVAELAYANIRGVCKIRRTETGADLPMPTTNDTGNSGAILNENTAASEQDVTFGAVIFNAYKITSKLVKVSQELLEDSALDFAAELGELLGTRLGRIEGSLTTTGTGSS